ncbi:hypothetical protein D3C85_1636950 [compost metagenome]
MGKIAPAVAQNTNTLRLHINDAASLKAKNTIKMNAFIKDAAASKKAVTVFSPTGWSKEFYTDSTGAFEFIPLWPGRYVVEISHMDKNPGKHHDKDYSATWQGATYSFEIN